MSSQCDINDSKPEFVGNPADILQFKEGKNIKITEETTSTNRIITIGYEEYKAPSITTSSSVGVTKVGVTVPTVTLSGNIVKGTEDIILRSTTPDKGLDLTQPFSWIETSVLGTSPGLWPRFSGSPLQIYAKDSEGTEVTKYAGVEYRHLFYMGYSTLDTINESGIKSLVTQDLLTSILSKYSSFTYNYTIVPAYIYWVFPADTTGFTEAKEGPLPVPLKLDLPNVTVIDEGISKSYRVIRTAAKTKLANANIDLL